jgi:hypothetical protein
MDGRSAFIDRGRTVRAVALCATVAAAACTATSPPPLPPRRVEFPPSVDARLPPPPEGVAPVSGLPPDLPVAAEAPPRDERYLGWTLAADAVSQIFLVGWMGHPRNYWEAGPALLMVPTIHALHGEFRSAGISIVMRAAMIGLVYLAGQTAERECRGSGEYICIPIGSFVLAETAIIVPVVIDSVVLARRRRPAEGWEQLPLLGATVDRGGGHLLTLSARF